MAATLNNQCQTSTPTIMHIVYRFGTGGLENGLVNLLNGLPTQLATHCVVSMTDISPGFQARVHRQDVEFLSLNKPAGQSARILPKLWSLIRSKSPAIVHSRNIAALECQVAALLAGVPHRIHGEHGWDTNDLLGSNKGYQIVRRSLKHLVHRQIALSAKTATYLKDDIRVPADRVVEIYNGVDTARFSRRFADRPKSWPFSKSDFIVGHVGRFSPVKNQLLLCNAFLQLRHSSPEFRKRGRLALIGDGPDLQTIKKLVAEHNAQESIWLAGDRADIPQILNQFDIFCLPSLAEGISNSILEAMSCELPVIAGNVGGNGELISDGSTGMLVESLTDTSLATSIQTYFENPDLCQRHAQAGRSRVEKYFTLNRMIEEYARLYTQCLYTAPTAWDSTGQMPEPK